MTPRGGSVCVECRMASRSAPPLPFLPAPRGGVPTCQLDDPKVLEQTEEPEMWRFICTNRQPDAF
eukprot:2705462-Amphidinium_carterae.1